MLLANAATRWRSSIPDLYSYLSKTESPTYLSQINIHAASDTNGFTQSDTYFLSAEQRIKNVLKRKRSFKLHKSKTSDSSKPKSKHPSSGRKSDSDDSIGSASDLRARQEQEEIDEKEDSETMTVNDSVLTCGSSAYHAECESMAREDHLPACRRYPRVADVPENKEVDSLFVGHSYGEKPLLADDELDKGDNVSPAPLIDMNDEQKVAKEQDVFSMAPFKVRTRKSRESNASHDDFLITMSPTVTEGSLVDFGEDRAYPFEAKRSSSSSCRGSFESGVFKGETAVSDNNPFSPSFNSTLALGDQGATKTKEDLFGAVPFDRMAVSVPNSSRNSNEIDDFISFGTEKPEDYHHPAGYYAGPAAAYEQKTCRDVEYIAGAGINNMSFEDLPSNGADFVELSFPSPAKANCKQIFFTPSKSNNPFS